MRTDSPIETLTEERRGNSALSKKLGNTGFARSLADKRRQTAFRPASRNSICARGPTQQDQELQVTLQ